MIDKILNLPQPRKKNNFKKVDQIKYWKKKESTLLVPIQVNNSDPIFIQYERGKLFFSIYFLHLSLYISRRAPIMFNLTNAT